MDADAERFDAKATVLIEIVRHHVEEEESDLFPKVRAALGRRALADLGEAMAQAKTTAPTSPHPPPRRTRRRPAVARRGRLPACSTA